MSDKVQERVEDRKAAFKAGLTAESGLQTRVGTSSALRKKFRDKRLNARRQRVVTKNAAEKVRQVLGETPNAVQALAHIDSLVVGLMQNEDKNVFDSSLDMLKGISCTEYIAPTVYTNGAFLARVAEIAMWPDVHQADSAINILINTAMIPGSTAALVRDGHALEICQRIMGNLESPLMLRISCVWLFANLVPTSYQVRDQAIDMGIADMLVANMNWAYAEIADKEFIPHEEASLLAHGYWALGNIFKGAEPPRWAKMEAPLGMVRRGIFEDETQEEIRDQCVWAMHYALDDMLVVETALRDSDMMRQLCLLAMVRNPKIALGALRSLGSIAMYINREVNGQYVCPLTGPALIDAGVINVLNATLEHTTSKLRREAAFLVVNLALCGWPVVEALDAADVIQIMLRKCDQETADVRMEAYRATANFVHACLAEGSGGRAQQRYGELLHGAFPVIYKMAAGLENMVSLVREDVTRAYLAILQRAEVTPVVQNQLPAIFNMMDEAGVIDSLEGMITHETMGQIGKMAEACHEIYKEFLADGDFEDCEMTDALMAPMTPGTAAAAYGSNSGWNNFVF